MANYPDLRNVQSTGRRMAMTKNCRAMRYTKRQSLLWGRLQPFVMGSNRTKAVIRIIELDVADCDG